MKRSVSNCTLLILTVCISLLSIAAEETATSHWRRIEIAEGWKIKSITPRNSLDTSLLTEAEDGEETGWYEASTMPAMVHDILHQHGRIDTPWLPGAAEKCRWVAEKDWIYATRFQADEPKAASLLRFNGLDTIVDVYLNGKLIASHSNMYLPLVVDVSGRLRKENTLVLHFHTVFERPGDKNSRIRNVNGDPSRRVRRPRQNYSNYLGPYPYFSRVGVYDKIFLEITHGSRIREVVAGASVDETLTVGTVTLSVAGTFKTGEATVLTCLIDPDGNEVATLPPQSLSEGSNFYRGATMRVDRPHLWWPRGYGDQPLYRVESTLMIDGKPHQTVSRTVGFRRVTMPKRLHFLVNGVPVRLWGGDWVTPRWDTAVWDQPRVDQLFKMAEHANFNAFRVWGVVESPRDEFYEMADARGFMLWQDFTDLPLAADDKSRAICRDEATHLLKRLKHHPSIFVWCGCNEAAMWNHQEYNGRLEDRGPWRGLVAAEEVGEICRKLDPAPPLHSLKRFMAPEDIWPADYSPIYEHGDVYPYPKTWLRYTTGSSWKKTGPVELFYDATDAASLVYRLGMAEALYYQDVTS